MRTTPARLVRLPGRMLNRAMRRREEARGFGVIAAIFIVVLLATMSAAIVRLSWTEQITFAQDVASSKASQAARAGIEWGLYQTLKGTWTACAGGSQTLDLRADTGFLVTVTCTYVDYSEGETGSGTPQTVRLFTLDAVACNGSVSCPTVSMVNSPAYVERRKVVQLTNI